MKIAIWHNLPSGGGKRALYYHVRGLAERGHTMEIWCPPTADREYLPLSEFATEHVVPLVTEPPRRPGRLDHAVQSQHGYLLDRMRAMDDHCRACAEQINQGGFDVFLGNSCHHWAVAPIARHVRIPSAGYIQEPWRALYEAHPNLPWAAEPPPSDPPSSPKHWKARLQRAIRVHALGVQASEEATSARAYDQLLVNSYFSRESLLRSYGTNSAVCYLGIDTARFAHRGEDRDRFVLGISSFTPAKNIAFVIDTVAAIPAAARPPLIWIGNASFGSGYLDEMRARAEAAGVDFQPRLRVPDTEMVDLMNRASAMVYAPRLEPFGFVPLEANACGVPVIAVAEGGVRETIVDNLNGYVVDNDPQAAAAAVIRLLDDPMLVRRLGQQAARHVADFWSLSAATDRIELKLRTVRDGKNGAQAPPDDRQPHPGEREVASTALSAVH